MEKEKIKESIWWISILTIFLCMTIGFLYWTGRVGEVTATGQYKNGTAYQVLQEITKNQRSIGTNGNVNCREFLIKTLKAEDIDVKEITSFVANTDLAPPVDSGEVHNLLAEIQGENEEAVLVVAHYDSVPCSSGAGDNAIAVSNLIQVASEINQEGKNKNTILFLFTDGEEIALLGAKGFSKDFFNDYDIQSVINLEGRGNSGIPLMFQATDGSTQLVREYANMLPFSVCSSLFADIYQYLTFDSDFTVYKDIVPTGLNFAFIEGLGAYHGVQDSAENLNIDTAYMQYLTVKQCLNYLENTDLKNLGNDVDHDLYLTTIPGKILFYPKWFNYVLIIISLLNIIWQRRENGRVVGINWLRSFLHIGISLVIGIAYIQGLKLINPYLYQSWRLQPLNSDLLLCGNAIIVFTLTIIIYEVFKKKNSVSSWELVMTVVIFFLEIICVVLIPSFVLPVFTMGVPAMVLGMIRKKNKKIRTVLYIFSLWIPYAVNFYTIRLFYETVPTYLGAVFMVILGVFLIHLFDVAEVEMSSKALRWIALSAIFLLVGIMTYQICFADFDTGQKRPSSLYVYQDLDGKDYFFTEQSELDQWQQDILGDDYISQADKMFFGMIENYKFSCIENADSITPDVQINCEYEQDLYSVAVQNEDFNAIYFLIENGNAVNELEINGEKIGIEDQANVIQEGSILLRVFNTREIVLKIGLNSKENLSNIRILGMNYGLSFETPELPDNLQEAWPGYMTYVGLTNLIVEDPETINYEREPVIKDVDAQKESL